MTYSESTLKKKKKNEVTLDSFWNFAYVSSYLHLKSFVWKRDYVILKTTNATEFIKTILESSYKVLLGTYILAAPTRPVLLLRAVEF